MPTKFKEKAELILEALFTGADEAEIARRDTEAPKIFIQEWLEVFLKRKDIHKNENDSYNVDGDVALRKMKLLKLPLRFNHVSGYFSCYDNELTSLEGAPKTVGGNFSCGHNNLTSLEGAPKTVGKDFNCRANKERFSYREVRKICDVKGRIHV